MSSINHSYRQYYNIKKKRLFSFIYYISLEINSIISHKEAHAICNCGWGKYMYGSREGNREINFSHISLSNIKYIGKWMTNKTMPYFFLFSLMFKPTKTQCL